MLTFDVDLSGVRSALDRTKNTVQLGMQIAVREAAEAGRDEAKASGLFKDRTGRLRSEIVARLLTRTTRSVEWEILSGAPYSRFVEEGTAAHEIRPRRARALRFQVGGETRFAAVVHHPGTSPRPFMGQGYYAAERRIFRELELMLNRVEHIWN